VTDAPRTLVVSNDFPPRVGGVQQYVASLVGQLPPDRVSVLAPNWPGWRAHDAGLPFPVHRWPARFLWPTADLQRRALDLARDHRADVILFGHGYPVSLIGPALRRAGLPYVVLTHGAEVWMARAPGIASTMRWAWSAAGAITVISEYTGRALSPLAPPGIQVQKITPAVDERRFRTDVDGSWVRDRHALGERPVVLCVSRLVARKGQDVLIAAMADVRRMIPDATLVLVGAGPDESRLRSLATTAPVGSVMFAGEAAEAELPGYYAACDVFAMPCRTRWAGLEVEGFGIVYLEAAASGRPVVAGRSGGAQEAVADGETGILVEGREAKAVALGLWHLLEPGGPGRTMGTAGRARVEAEYTWRRRGRQVAAILRRVAGQEA